LRSSTSTGEAVRCPRGFLNAAGDTLRNGETVLPFLLEIVGQIGHIHARDLIEAVFLGEHFLDGMSENRTVDLGAKRVAFVEQILQEILLLARQVVNEVEPHPGQALERDVLLLHGDGLGEPAETQAVGDDPGIDAIGLVQVGVGLPKLVDEFRVDGKHPGVPLFERFILMEEHRRMPTVDRGGFKPDVDLGRRQLVRNSNNLIAQV